MGLISVRTDLVLETLVGSLHEAALERAAGTGDDLLRDLGWHARALELERFAPARQPMPWLVELLDGDADPGSVSLSLARQEPAERPEPGAAPSWRVPGPGGHVRHYLAVRAAGATGASDLAAAKRAWMTGFFRHCCLEAAGGRSHGS